MNTAIVLAAGKGSRMKAGINKQFLQLGNRPVLAYALQNFQDCDAVEEIIVMTAAEEIEYVQSEIVQKYGFSKVRKIIAGGAERQQSAYKGIMAAHQDSEIILLHDGARPFVTRQTILACINQAREYGAVSAGMPSKDTIKLVNKEHIVTATPPRDGVWITQTPQAFQREVIIKAHQIAAAEALIATDDAMLVEAMGHPVKMVAGAYENMKITTPEDIALAEQLLKIINIT